MTKTETRSTQRILGENRWLMLGLLLILAFNIGIRWRLADMPLERDEGEYAYAGQLLLQGNPPYRDAYNMKFPGTYLAYAGMMAVFGETARGIHIGLAFVTSLLGLLVFFIGKKLFDAQSALLGTAVCILMTASAGVFGLAGHATHFVALFATAGTLALLWASESTGHWRWLIAGIFFGIATLMKQHAAILAALGLGWVGLVTFQQTRALPSALKRASFFLAGCSVPLALTGLWLMSVGVWKPFIFWTIEYATQYASAVSIRAAWPGFVNGFGPVFAAGWGLWLLGLVGFVATLLPKQPPHQKLVACLFIGGMLGACPGFHFRGHYFLMAVPGLALCVAAIWCRTRKTIPRPAAALVYCAALAMLAWNNKGVWLEATPNQAARMLYSLNPFNEAPEVAAYLRDRTAPDERIAVVGSEPQIYFHANRKAASGYIYMYALTEPLPLAQKMRDEFAQEIEAANPRYIVFVDIITSWVSLSQADSSILEWWNRYSKNYDAVAAVTLSANQPTQFVWDEAAVKNLTLSDCHLIVYRRK